MNTTLRISARIAGQVDPAKLLVLSTTTPASAEKEAVRPGEIVVRLRRPRNSPKAIQDEQVETLLDHLTDPSDEALIAFFIGSGLRLSELCTRSIPVPTRKELFNEDQ